MFKGKHEAAEPLYRHEMEITEAILRKDQPDLSADLNNLDKPVTAKWSDCCFRTHVPDIDVLDQMAVAMVALDISTSGAT